MKRKLLEIMYTCGECGNAFIKLVDDNGSIFGWERICANDGLCMCPQQIWNDSEVSRK